MYKLELKLTNVSTNETIEFNDTLIVTTAGATVPVYLTGDNREHICYEALTDDSLIDNKTIGVKAKSSGVMHKLTNNGTTGNKDAYTKLRDLDNNKAIYTLVEFKICNRDIFEFKAPQSNTVTKSNKPLDIGF